MVFLVGSQQTLKYLCEQYGNIRIVLRLQSTSTYLGDVPEVEEVVYFCRGREHTCGDKIINFNGGLGHDISEGFHILIKVLQLLVDHCAKYPFDLALLGDQEKRWG